MLVYIHRQFRASDLRKSVFTIAVSINTCKTKNWVAVTLNSVFTPYFIIRRLAESAKLKSAIIPTDICLYLSSTFFFVLIVPTMQ